MFMTIFATLKIKNIMKKIIRNLATCCMTFGIISIVGTAQESDINSKISSLETKVAKMPTISGYVNTLFLSDFDNTNTLNIKRARLSVAGNLSSKFDYKVQFAMEGTPKLIDAYIRFKIAPEFNIQVGQFKVPLIYENYMFSPMTLESIDNTMLTGNYLNNSAGRDIGITAYGSVIERDGFSLIDYTIGVFNGSGINKADADKAKDIAGRVHVNILKELAITGSMYLGTENATETIHYNRFGGGVVFDNDQIIFRSEFYAGNDDGLKTNGCYALAEYWITPKFAPMVRFDNFNYDTSFDNASQTNYVIGVDYWPISSVRLQANYTCKTFNDDVVPTTNHLGIMLSYKF